MASWRYESQGSIVISYYNSTSAARYLNWPSQAHFVYRVGAIGVDADAEYLDTSGNAHALYVAATLDEFRIRWDEHMARYRAARAEFAAWRESKPVAVHA
jgi:hypothetical protein